MTGTPGAGPGPDRRIGRETRLECHICWYRYDPVEGDPAGGVPPGTAFFELPTHWTCPQCDGDRQGFLVCRD